MKVLCVDDERIQLDLLKRTVEQSEYISEAAAFDDEEEALKWARSHPVDLAFLDIELHAMNGLELAEELLKIHSGMAVVFVTSYERYALKTIKMHIDAGYIVKPFRFSQVQEEIDHIVKRTAARRRLKAVCFGDFEVFADGKPLEFKRKKTKELLAYLIDRRGSVVSSNQACAVLWEDEGNDDNKRDYLYHLIVDLKSTLESANAQDVFISQKTGYSVNTESIDCDYYQMIGGDAYAVKKYTGEYMNQYSWAEMTNAWLEKEYHSRKKS